MACRAKTLADALRDNACQQGSTANTCAVTRTTVGRESYRMALWVPSEPAGRLQRHAGLGTGLGAVAKCRGEGH